MSLKLKLTALSSSKLKMHVVVVVDDVVDDDDNNDN